MPLSEREQRILEQMERALYAEDPKFAAALDGRRQRMNSRRRGYSAIVGFIVGIAMLITGMIVKQVWLSVIGFLVMLACAILSTPSWLEASKAPE